MESLGWLPVVTLLVLSFQLCLVAAFSDASSD